MPKSILCRILLMVSVTTLFSRRTLSRLVRSMKVPSGNRKCGDRRVNQRKIGVRNMAAVDLVLLILPNQVMTSPTESQSPQRRKTSRNLFYRSRILSWRISNTFLMSAERLLLVFAVGKRYTLVFIVPANKR